MFSMTGQTSLLGLSRPSQIHSSFRGLSPTCQVVFLLAVIQIGNRDQILQDYYERSDAGMALAFVLIFMPILFTVAVS